MPISSHSCLSAYERADFAARCRRQGYCPEQFRLSADVDFPPLDEPAHMIREIHVTHMDYAGNHRYRRDDVSNWLDAFERDLRDGLFCGRCRDGWTPVPSEGWSEQCA